MYLYYEGGYIESQPFNNARRYWDFANRVFHDYETGADVSRPFNAAENQMADIEEVSLSKGALREELEDKVVNAFQSNNAFLAIASPTNAQVLAQVKALTRQNNAIMKLLVSKLMTDSSGT